MAKIPTWEPQVEPSASMNMPKKDVFSQGREYRELEGMGSDLMKRAEEMNHERDVLDAQNAVMKLADAERSFISGERQKQGRDARGASQRATEWYDAETPKYADGLSAKAQQMYELHASRVRDRGLNMMSSHEAGQFQREKEMALEGSIAMAKEQIKAGNTPEDIDIVVGQIREQIQETYKGFDNSKMVLAAEEALYKELLIEKANTDPSNINALIEKYKGKIGADDLRQIKDHAEKINIDDTVDAKMTEYRARFGENYEAMTKALRTEKVSDRVKAKLRTTINADFATFKAFEQDRKDKANDALSIKIGKAFLVKDFGAMQKLVEDAPDMAATTRLSMLNSIQQHAEALRSGKDSPFEKEDPQQRFWLQTAIVTHPELIREQNIIDLAGKHAIKGDEVPKLLNMLQHYRENKDPDLNAAIKLVKSWESKKVWSKDDKKKNDAWIAADMIKELISLRRANPEMDIAKDFIEPNQRELRKSQYRAIFSNFLNKNLPDEKMEAMGDDPYKWQDSGKPGGMGVRKKIVKLDDEGKWWIDNIGQEKPK